MQVCTVKPRDTNLVSLLSGSQSYLRICRAVQAQDQVIVLQRIYLRMQGDVLEALQSGTAISW